MKSINYSVIFFLFLGSFVMAQSTGGTFIHPDGEVFMLEQEGPIYPGCEGLVLESEKESCSRSEFERFILENVELDPAPAGTARVATMRFVIEPDGSISNIELPSCCCVEFGEQLVAAAESFNELNLRWIPGIKDGSSVRSYYDIEIIVVE